MSPPSQLSTEDISPNRADDGTRQSLSLGGVCARFCDIRFPATPEAGKSDRLYATYGRRSEDSRPVFGARKGATPKGAESRAVGQGLRCAAEAATFLVE